MKILQMTQYYLLVSSVNYDIFVGMLVSHIKIIHVFISDQVEIGEEDV